MKSKAKPDESVKQASPASSQKKLVQARLPFSTLSTTPKSSEGDSRKRKLSSTDDDLVPTPKINRLIETKENVGAIADPVVVLSEDESLIDDTQIAIDHASEKPDEKIQNSSYSDSKPDQVTPQSRKKHKNKSAKKDRSKKIVWNDDDGGDSEEIKIAIKLPASKKRKLSAKIKDICQKETITKPSEEEKNDGETEVAKCSNVADVQPNDEKLEKNDEQPSSSSGEKEEILDPVDGKNENDDCCLIGENVQEDTSEEALNTSVQEEKIKKTIIDASGTTTPKRMESVDVKLKLTPKQIQKKLEIEQRQVEKQKAKEEREKKLQEEKELRRKEREEKERQKKQEREEKEELRRKEREEKEEQRRKEKEDREKKRQAEIDAKNEEKRLKEEERKRKEEMKEEERKKKEEEKIAVEEAKIKKTRKEAEAFTKFFLPRKSLGNKIELAQDAKQEDDPQSRQNFMPFQIKEDMKLAPTARRTLSMDRKTALDKWLVNGTVNGLQEEDLYLMNLRTGERMPENDERTWTCDDDEVKLIEDELEKAAVIIEEEQVKQIYRAKYFKFEENQRPPYYGTWRKTSKIIKPRKPFATDVKFFDYEIDSDDEWEEEEPGESLHGSDDEKEKDSDDDYMIDNEFFVPHGHLSDEELQEDGDDEDNSPAAQKEKLKIIQKQFADEMSKKTEKIKPRLVGLIWQNRDGTQPSVGCPNIVWDMLMARAMLLDGNSISMTKPTIGADNDENESGEEEIERKPQKRSEIAEDVVGDLLRLVHGNFNNKNFLVREFRAYLAKQNKEGESNSQTFSKLSILRKIKKLAQWRGCPDDGPYKNKFCWYVPADVLEAYGMKDVTMPNSWAYTLTPPKLLPPPVVDQPEDSKSVVKQTKASTNGGIQKFTTVLTESDKKKNFVPPKMDTKTLGKDPKETGLKTKKRVQLLMSVPRGQEIPTKAKMTLISQFLNDKGKAKENNSENATETKRTAEMDVDGSSSDDIVLIE